MRVVLLAVAVAGVVWGQSFEVASVKAHPLEPGRLVVRIPSGRDLQVTGDRFREEAATLNDLIMDAYGVASYQIANAPKWDDHFDVDAKSDGVPTADQLRTMLQALLADRFKLKLHRETREFPVYALVIGKTGSKLRPLRDDEHPKTYATRPVERPATVMTTVPVLISLISRFVDRPVVDQTNLTGMYEFANLDYRQLGDSIFAAIQQELGLRLEPRKDPLEVLVIDRAEKPAAN